MATWVCARWSTSGSGGRGDRPAAAAGGQRHPPRPGRGSQATPLPPADREHQLRPRPPAGGARLRHALRPRPGGRPGALGPLREHVRQRLDPRLRRGRPPRRAAPDGPRPRGGRPAAAGRKPNYPDLIIQIWWDAPPPPPLISAAPRVTPPPASP